MLPRLTFIIFLFGRLKIVLTFPCLSIIIAFATKLWQRQISFNFEYTFVYSNMITNMNLHFHVQYVDFTM